MIWRHGLNADGYGRGSFPCGEYLAHRQAFRQTGRRSPKSNILHLCHRPYCIQPSHLYEGDAHDNADDRKLRVQEGLEWSLYSRKTDAVREAAKHRWKASLNGQPSLIRGEATHQCRHVAPAMDRRICPDCGSSDASEASEQEHITELQPYITDRNVVEIVGHNRSFTDMGNGIVAQMDATTTKSIPLNRAERRRREKAHKKDPMRNKPRLLSLQEIELSENGTMSFSAEGTEGITGPGSLVVMGHLPDETG